MRFRVALPVTEILLVALLGCVLAACWMGWQVIGPGDSAPEYASPIFTTVGNQLYLDGKLVGTWVPAANETVGYWQSVPLNLPPVPATEVTPEQLP